MLGGEVRRTSIHIKKSSNLPDDKNDFPYVLFLIKVTFIFYWYKMCNLFASCDMLAAISILIFICWHEHWLLLCISFWVFVDRLCQLLSFSSSQQQWLQILDSFISSPLCSDSFYNISDRSDGFLQWKRGFSLFFFQSLKMCGQSFLHHRNVLLFRCINVLQFRSIIFN